METLNSKPLRHFVKHVFIIGKVYRERNKAKQAIGEHLKKMRNSIIRMNLSYNDIERLKQKISNLINWERKYAKFFKVDDKETQELKKQITILQDELRSEREAKQSLATDYDKKIKELSESLQRLKHKTSHLLMEKAKRQQRLNALDQKINKKVDVNRYFHS